MKTGGAVNKCEYFSFDKGNVRVFVIELFLVKVFSSDELVNLFVAFDARLDDAHLFLEDTLNN